MRVTVVLPLPSPKLTAQAKGHRFSRSSAIKDARNDGGFAALAAINKQVDKWDMPRQYVMEKATITYKFYLKTNVRADEANLIQTCKAYVDGCVDAKLVSGDHWQVLHIAEICVAVDPKNPRVELIFDKLDETNESLRPIGKPGKYPKSSLMDGFVPPGDEVIEKQK